jgi:hypothetical protein
MVPILEHPVCTGHPLVAATPLHLKTPCARCPGTAAHYLNLIWQHVSGDNTLTDRTDECSASAHITREPTPDVEAQEPNRLPGTTTVTAHSQCTLVAFLYDYWLPWQVCALTMAANPPQVGTRTFRKMEQRSLVRPAGAVRWTRQK